MKIGHQDSTAKFVTEVVYVERQRKARHSGSDTNIEVDISRVILFRSFLFAIWLLLRILLLTQLPDKLI